MFSQLGPLFKTTFRQAEANDTRQAIPHNERDTKRKKQEEDNSPETNNDLWEDNTSVTVEALHTFLINFLQTLSNDEAIPTSSVQPNQTPQALSTRPPEKIRPTNTKNAKAVRAYQATAGQNHTPAPMQENTTISIDADKLPLQSKELRDIHRLIDDLNILNKNKIYSLNILKAESFIESLKNAVGLAKSNL